jgi:hypothetical protein
MEVNGALLTALSNLVTLEGEDIFQLQLIDEIG